MKKYRTSISFLLLLVLGLSLTAKAQDEPQPSLSDLVNKPYFELLVITAQVKVSPKEIEEFRTQLHQEKLAEQKKVEAEETRLTQQIKEFQNKLNTLNKSSSSDTPEMAAERKKLHCLIYKLEREKRKLHLVHKSGIPVAYENKLAKLDMVALWPAKESEIKQKIAAGTARQRHFGNAEDIGVRVISNDQEKDIKLGERTVADLKANGLLPPELEDQKVVEYINRLCETIAIHSDLKIPLRVKVLESEEINAFALPGGYLFINTGLIEHTRNESELAGVIAHEVAHIAARHGARLLKRFTIASIIFEAAQIAAIILTGGVATIGAYYALQYGFFGLGMVLNLALLGVSRDFETEADQLGIQYLWHAGYDTRGFISFFDYLASQKGYVTSTSFFRTHPPFFDRMVSTFSEIRYLPEKENVILDSSDFQETQALLKQLVEKRKTDRKKAPSFKKFPDCDE